MSPRVMSWTGCTWESLTVYPPTCIHDGTLEDLAEAHRTGLEGRRRRDDLVDRPWLEHVGDGAVADRVPLGGLEVVGVEPGIGGHRVDIAGARVHHDDRPALRPVLLHGALQRLLGQVLDLAVEGRHERPCRGSPAPRPRSRSRSATRLPTTPPCGFRVNRRGRPGTRTRGPPAPWRRPRRSRAPAARARPPGSSAWVPRGTRCRGGRAPRASRRPRHRPVARGTRTWNPACAAVAPPAGAGGRGSSAIRAASPIGSVTYRGSA